MRRNVGEVREAGGEVASVVGCVREADGAELVVTRRIDVPRPGRARAGIVRRRRGPAQTAGECPVAY